MANEEHLRILKKGVEVWNEWRKQDKRLNPDLSGINLRSELRNDNMVDIYNDLDGINFSNTNLSGVDLAVISIRNANFFGADLSLANLHLSSLQNSNFDHAKLEVTNLTSASIDEASFSMTKMHGAIMRKVYMPRATFNYAKLDKADFYEAFLLECTFEDSTLRYVDFTNAVLRGVKMSSCNLFHAVLSHTDVDGMDFHASIFHQTYLQDINFTDTNLTQVRFGGTKIQDIDLRTIQDLETIIHDAPSSLSISTLSLSQGEIPFSFLKQCGLSNWEIESVKLYQKNLTSNEITDAVYKIDEIRNLNPIQIHNLFISYSHNDVPFVDYLETWLDIKGIRFWRDIHDAPAGPLEEIVLNAIADNQVVLLIFSKDSVKSDWVEFEITKARELEKKLDRHVICPIALDDSWKTAKWSGILMNQVKQYNILDFSDWRDELVFKKQFKKLIKGLDLFYKK